MAVVNSRPVVILVGDRAPSAPADTTAASSPSPSPSSSSSSSSSLSTANTTPVMGVRSPASTRMTDGVDAALPASLTRPQRTAQRELTAHAREMGVAPSASAIAAAERSAAIAADPRVTTAAFDRACDRARRAISLQPQPQTVLSGFTRVIDAKLTLSPSVVQALCSAVAHKDGGPDQLLDAIDHGPGDGAIVWARPKNLVEFVASIVRQLVLGGGASMQLQISAEHAAFLEGVLKDDGAPLRLAMGGAGAFASNVLSALPPVRPRFFAHDPLPATIAERFAERVEIVDGTGSRTTPHKHSAPSEARINFSCEYSAGQALVVLGRKSITINGHVVEPATSGSGRVILGTKAKDVVPGFGGVSDDALATMAQRTDTAFLVGTHYLTQGSPAEAEQAALALARSLQRMKAENPKLLRHHQYVIPKQASNEGVVMAATKGAFDSLSMNAVEAPALVARLRGAKMTTLGAGIDEHQDRTRSEEPAHMLDSALCIKDAMTLSRVHFHGLLGDLIVIDDGPGVDVDRTRLALLRARQLASMKAANDSGEIKSADDLFDVVPVVSGKCLAAVERFADAISSRYQIDDAARSHVAAEWHYFDTSSKQHLFFVPSRGIHERSGGTVSLGDTIDIAALVFSRTETKPKLPPRLQTA